MNINQLSKLLNLLTEVDSTHETQDRATGKHIVILQRGWVVVGDLSWSGTEGTLENASVIRVWGTQNGIGEIALNGPTEKTKLDPCGTITFHELTSVAKIPCNENKWS